MARLTTKEKQVVRGGLKFILTNQQHRASFSDRQLDAMESAASKYGMTETRPAPKVEELHEVIGRKLGLNSDMVDQLGELLGRK